MNLKTLKNKIEALGWNVYEDISFGGGDTGWQISQCSNLGEDFGFCIVVNNLPETAIKNIKEYAYNFDPDEHAEMWVDLRGQNGVPNSIRDLIEDADYIKKMLEDLADSL